MRMATEQFSAMLKQYLSKGLKSEWLNRLCFRLYRVPRTVWVEAVLTLALLGVAYWMLIQVQRPSEPAIRHLLAQFRMYGIFVFSVVPILGVMRHKNLGLLFNQWARGFAIYAAISFLLGSGHADRLFLTVTDAPLKSAMSVILAVLCFAVVYFSGVLDKKTSRRTHGTYSAPSLLMSTDIPCPATRRDVRYTAAHETGHVILYSAFPNPPDELRIVVHLEASTKGVMGFVSGLNVEHQLTEKTFSEWYMLMCLAGQFGEKHIHAEVTLGNADDVERWMHVAMLYLSSGAGGGIYYQEPKSLLEIQYNEKKLNQLRMRQEQCLEQFFDLNAELINEMYFRVMEQKELDVYDIRDLLRKVNFPADFPRPNEQSIA
jgi:hypothetical protein